MASHLVTINLTFIFLQLSNACIFNNPIFLRNKKSMDSKLLNYAKVPIPVLNNSSPHNYVIMPALLAHIDSPLNSGQFQQQASTSRHKTMKSNQNSLLFQNSHKTNRIDQYDANDLNDSHNNIDAGHNKHGMLQVSGHKTNFNRFFVDKKASFQNKPTKL